MTDPIIARLLERADVKALVDNLTAAGGEADMGRITEALGDSLSDEELAALERLSEAGVVIARDRQEGGRVTERIE